MNMLFVAASFILNMKLILKSVAHFMIWKEILAMFFSPKFYNWIYVKHWIAWPTSIFIHCIVEKKLHILVENWVEVNLHYLNVKQLWRTAKKHYLLIKVRFEMENVGGMLKVAWLILLSFYKSRWAQIFTTKEILFPSESHLEDMCASF